MTFCVGHPYPPNTDAFIYSPWVVGAAIAKDTDGLIGQSAPFPLTGRQLMALQWKVQAWRVQCTLFAVDQTVQVQALAGGTAHPAKAAAAGGGYWQVIADDPRYPAYSYGFQIGSLLSTYLQPCIDSATTATDPVALLDACYTPGFDIAISLASNEESETYPGNPESSVNVSLGGGDMATVAGTLTVTGFSDEALNWTLPILRSEGDHTYPTCDITMTATEWNWPDFT